MSNNQSTIINTPLVECEWALIKEPSYQFDSNGIYEIDLLFDVQIPEHKQFLAMLKGMIPQGVKNQPWKKHKEKPGVFTVKCKQKAKVHKDNKVFEFKPKVFDSQGNVVVDIPLIGNGSKVCANLEVRPYTLQGGGVSLKPLAIQIASLVPYTKESTQSSSPFGAIQGGDFKTETFSSQTQEQGQQESVDDFNIPQENYVPEEQYIPQDQNIPVDEFDF